MLALVLLLLLQPELTLSFLLLFAALFSQLLFHVSRIVRPTISQSLLHRPSAALLLVHDELPCCGKSRLLAKDEKEL